MRLPPTSCFSRSQSEALGHDASEERNRRTMEIPSPGWSGSIGEPRLRNGATHRCKLSTSQSRPAAPPIGPKNDPSTHRTPQTTPQNPVIRGVHSRVSPSSCDNITILSSTTESGTPPMGQRQGRGSRINTLPALSGGASTLSSPSTHFITSASLNSAPAFIEDTRIFCSERSISRLSAVINTAKSEAECVQLSANETTPTWLSVPKASDRSEQRSEGPRFQMSSPRSYWPGPMKATAGQTMA
jgi:hypothetical protein